MRFERTESSLIQLTYSSQMKSLTETVEAERNHRKRKELFLLVLLFAEDLVMKRIIKQRQK